MPRLNFTDSEPNYHTAPSTADIEAAALASLQGSRNFSQQKASLPRPKAARKPVPPMGPTTVAFPAGDTSHHDTSISFSSQHRPALPGPSTTTSSYKRTMSSPSPSPPPPAQGQVSQSPFVSSAGQPAAGPAASASFSPKLSSSLARNSSVPASLTHNAPSSSNLPARASSVSHNRPSLSSPSPPTPIVPSIPLRHATQHSPVKPTYTNLVSHTTYPRGSLDRHPPSKKPHTEHSPSFPPFTTASASDPNLPSRTSTPVIPTEQPNYYTLPLKQLLAKPAVPSQLLNGSESASDGGGGGPSSNSYQFSAAHRRSASTIDSSVVQFAAPRRNSDISVIELAAIRALQPRTPFKSKSASSVIRDRKHNDGSYHYRRAGAGVVKDDDGKERRVRVQTAEGSGWWPDWRPEEEMERKRKEKDKTSDPSRPRNVLKRRPSNSTRPSGSDSHDLQQPQSTSGSGIGSRLSRSLSASSLLKRAGLFTSLNPNRRSVSPIPPSKSTTTSSDAPGNSVMAKNDLTTSSHDDRISVQHHQTPDNGQQVRIGNDVNLGVPTSGGSAALPSSSSPVSKDIQSATLSSTIPPERHRLPLTQTRLSTISSGSSATSTDTRRKSRDINNKNMSPAGAVADAYKRQQQAKAENLVAVAIAPTRPPRPPLTPELPPTVGDPDLPSSSHRIPAPSNTNSALSSNSDSAANLNQDAGTLVTSGSKHLSASSSSGEGSALSYADILNNKVDVAEKTGGLIGENSSEAREPPNLQQQRLQQRSRASFPGEARGNAVVTREKDAPPIAGSARESLVHSPPPSASSTSAVGLEMASLPYAQKPSSRTSSPLASPPMSPPPLSSPPVSLTPLSPPPWGSSQRTTNKSNKLRKARHTSDESELSHSPYYTVVGTRSDQVFSVGGPRDSFEAGYSDMEKATWGIRSTITAGRANTSGDGGEKEKSSIGKSLSRKLSGRFIKVKEREMSPENKDPSTVVGVGGGGGASSGNRGRASTSQDGQGRGRVRPKSSRGAGVPAMATSTNSPKSIYTDEEKGGESDDRCFPSLYPLKKHAQSEADLSSRERDEEKEKEKESDGMIPRLRRFFGGGRSKSRERNEVVEGEHGRKTDKPPPLPALPKNYVSALNDIYTPIYARQHQAKLNSTSTSPRTSHKSPGRSRSAKSSPTTLPPRPSTATTPTRSSSDVPYWSQRSHSAGSSATSLQEVPPMPSPLPDLKRYTTDDGDSRSKTKASKDTTATSTRSPRTIHANTEGDSHKPPLDADVHTRSHMERSESPPIPSFSTAEPINSFPPRRSSDQRSKNSPTSPTALNASTPSPTNLSPKSPQSPPPRPARSPQRPSPKVLVHSRTNSFSDEALYPPVMKNGDSSTRSIPMMTFRELEKRTDNVARKRLTEQEKADRWDALLEKSEAAGGTLHFAGGDDKLPSDELRFSKTLSELARDDESVSTSVI